MGTTTRRRWLAPAASLTFLIGALATSCAINNDDPQIVASPSASASASASASPTGEKLSFITSITKDAPAEGFVNAYTKAHGTGQDNKLSFGSCDVVATTGELAQRSVKVDGHEGALVVFAPAGARDFLNRQADKLEDCGVKYDRDGNDALLTPGGVTVIRGDALVSVGAKDDERKKVAETLRDSLKAPLSDSKCASQDTQDSDVRRNRELAGSSYTGVTESTTVKTKVDSTGVPDPQIPALVDLKDTDAKKPEEPIPASVEAEPDSTMDKPTITGTAKAKPATEANASYQVIDTTGPGCGWAWTGFDNHEPKDLGYRKQRAIDDTQRHLDDDMRDYVQSAQSYAVQSLSSMTTADRWNAYAARENKRHAQYKRINTARADFKNTWTKYVQEYNYWANFDELKATAQQDYQSQVADCRTREQEQRKWDASHGDDDSPQRPTTCAKDPEKPAILDAKAPENPPKAPKVPEAVGPIPNSWPKPDTSNVKDEDK